MVFSSLELKNINNNNRVKHLIRLLILSVLVVLASLSCFWSAPAWAGIDDDKYDGNIYILYAGNGSLVPPRLSLKQSLDREMPTVIVYYVDDSKDCKQFSVVVSRIQEFYGRAANIMPISIDALDIKANYTPQEVGFYYEGAVPQTVILNQKGEVVFNGKGQVRYEAIDDVLRKVFNLLPRSESETLKVRTFNEFNSELVE